MYKETIRRKKTTIKHEIGHGGPLLVQLTCPLSRIAQKCKLIN